jgi:hypothetical protein
MHEAGDHALTSVPRRLAAAKRVGTRLYRALGLSRCALWSLESPLDYVGFPLTATDFCGAATFRDVPIPDVKSLLLLFFDNALSHRDKHPLMCSNGLLDSREPFTAFYRLVFDKKLDKLAIETRAGVDRIRQSIKVGALNAKQMRCNVLKSI